MMTKTWQLEDVSSRAKDARYTFYLPSKTALKMLKPGDEVKLIFLCDIENDKGWSAERMWVQITKIGLFSFEGFLDNEPYYIPDLKAGELIKFKTKHIIQMSIDDPVPNMVDKYFSRCYVTSSVLDNKKKVTRLYREKPEKDEENYSGWTLYSLEDSEEYLNDSSNWNYVSLGAVLNKDDRFISLLESEYDSDFFWNEDKKLFETVD